MLIPGFLVSAVTFPGVIIHELAHQLFCIWTKTPVVKVCYFQFERTAGYVIHEKAKTPEKTVIIGIGPFIINTLLGILVTLSAAIPISQFGSGDWLDYLQMWLGISILMHAFPSTGDAKTLWEAMRNTEGKHLLKLICYPLILLIHIGAWGSILWLDFFYGVSVSILVPSLIVKLLA